MLTILVAGLAVAQANAATPNIVSNELGDVLIITVRHRRSDFGTRPKAVAELKTRYVPQGYDLLGEGQKRLLLDHALLESTPAMLSARITEHFATRDFAAEKVGELPARLRDAVVNNLTRTLPGLSREAAAEMTIRLEGAVYVDATNPPGLPSTKQQGLFLGKEMFGPALPARPLPLSPVEAPAEDANAGSKSPLEVRMFTLRSGDDGGNVVELWDELRPLMKRREKELADIANARLSAMAATVGRWAEEKTGCRLGEERAFSSLKPESRALLARGLGRRESDLEDSKIKIGPGRLRLVVGISARGNLSFQLSSLGQ